MKKNGIVILNYNSKELTTKLANKLSNFDCISNIVVVDNCSLDVFYASDFNSDKIHFIKNSKNTGYAAGNNVGLKYLIDCCKCDVVFIANPDVDFNPDAIEAIDICFDEDENTVLCSTLRYGCDGEIIHQYFDFPSLKNSIINCFITGRRKLGQYKVLNQTNEIRYSISSKKYVDAVPGAFFGIRSSFLKEINYLYEGTFLYCEELFIGYAARKNGKKACVTNSAIYYHNHQHKAFSKSSKRMFYLDRKSLILFYRYYHLVNIFQILLLKLCVFLGTIEYSTASSIYRLIKRIIKR